MKLVLAIINDEDAQKLISYLTQNNFQVTKLASTGGFLRVGNTTVLIGVEEDKLEQVLDLIRGKCHTTKRITAAGQPCANGAEGYFPYPLEVTAGGATVFVMDVEQFFKC